MSAGQPELPIDPPAEPEDDSELTDLIGDAHELRSKFQGIGVDLADAKLLTEEEDRNWEYSFVFFEQLLEAATDRLAAVSAERREAAAEDEYDPEFDVYDPEFDVKEAADGD